MKIPEQYRIKNTIKYPTSILVGGMSRLGFEIADSLIEQGGYVIIVDTFTPENIDRLKAFPKETLISFVDYTSLPHLEAEVRRLDYVFYFAHDSQDFTHKISTQEFLNYSNYLDTTLELTSKFQAKFLLTTAIRAHQILMSADQIDPNFGTMVSARHLVYTDMEFQRYAESLAIEYVEKINLDVRILRLGELIGDGMDFSKNSAFVDIINQAVQDKTIKLRKDGLEQEWFVHILDAAYGIIKAQFSQGTGGKVYSIAYDHPFTHLSIAYKIQEIEENIQDIQFVDEKDNLPPLKLYKPAPNLSQIGWVTKVEFEKAVEQSLLSAKIHTLEKNTAGESKVFDKLKNFLAIAKEDDSTQNLGGAVSKLIEERKQYEKLKRQRVNMASVGIKERKKYKPRTFGEKVNNTVWNSLYSLSNSFLIFKNKSATEIVAMIVASIVLLVFYFAFVSPVILVAKELYLLNITVDSLNQEISEADYSKLKERGESLQSSSSKSIKALESIDGLANLISLSDENQELIQVLKGYQIAGEGMIDVSKAIEPFFNYIEQYEQNTQLRLAQESYLTVGDQTKDYSSILGDSYDSRVFIDTGLSKMQRANELIRTQNIFFLPSFAENFALENIQKLSQVADDSSKFSSYKFIPEIIGVRESINLAVIVLDNTRQKPIGGEAATLALLNFEKGELIDVIVLPPNDQNLDFSELTETDLQAINSRRFTYLQNDTLGFADLGNVREMQEYTSLVEKVIEKTYEIELNAVLTLNLVTLEDLLVELNTDNSLVINNQEFSSNLLQDIRSLEGANATVDSRNERISEIFAFVLNKSLDDVAANIGSLEKILSESITAGNAHFATIGMESDSFWLSTDASETQLQNADHYFSVGISLEDPTLLNSSRFPFARVSATTQIDNEFSISTSLNLQFENLGISQEVSVCLPFEVESQTIKISGVPEERTVLNSLNFEKCVVAKVLDESELNISWEYDAFKGGDLLDTFFSVSRVKGTQPTSIDYSIQFDNLYTLDESLLPQDVSTSEQEIQITGSLSKDYLLPVRLTR